MIKVFIHSFRYYLLYILPALHCLYKPKLRFLPCLFLMKLFYLKLILNKSLINWLILKVPRAHQFHEMYTDPCIFSSSSLSSKSKSKLGCFQANTRQQAAFNAFWLSKSHMVSKSFYKTSEAKQN